MLRFIIAVCAFVALLPGCNQSGAEKENGASAQVPPAGDPNPTIVQFRIVADGVRHRQLYDLADAQMRDESRQRKPWSAVVWSDVDPKKPAGYWFKVVDEKTFGQGPDRQKLRSSELVRGGPQVSQMLVAADAFDVNRSHIARAAAVLDERGKPAVDISLTPDGAKKMLELTAASLPNESGRAFRLAVVLDGVIVTAPAIRGAISDRGEFSGEFTNDEVDRIVNIFNAVDVRAPTKSGTPGP